MDDEGGLVGGVMDCIYIYSVGWRAGDEHLPRNCELSGTSEFADVCSSCFCMARDIINPSASGCM